MPPLMILLLIAAPCLLSFAFIILVGAGNDDGAVSDHDERAKS